MNENINPMAALLDAIRQGPEPVIGYDERGESQKAFNFGWNTKADRVWGRAEVAKLHYDELVAALQAAVDATTPVKVGLPFLRQGTGCTEVCQAWEEPDWLIAARAALAKVRPC